MAIAPVRVSPETRDILKTVGRELSARYDRDFTLGEVIRWMIHGYAGNNPKLAEHLKEIIAAIPETPLIPENKDE